MFSPLLICLLVSGLGLMLIKSGRALALRLSSNKAYVIGMITGITLHAGMTAFALFMSQ